MCERSQSVTPPTLNTTIKQTFTIGSSMPVAYKRTVLTLHCEFLNWKSENDLGPNEPVMKLLSLLAQATK